jgi:uncharacterized RDD family membrane protein YckC
MIDTFSENNNTSNVTYATFAERFGAFFLDSLLLWILLAFLGNLLNEKPEHVFIGIIFSLKGSSLQIATAWLYFALQESSQFEGTVGKRAFKIRVTDLSGKRVSFAKASLRYFSKFISYIILGIGFLMMLRDDKFQTLHDRIAATIVIK